MMTKPNKLLFIILSAIMSSFIMVSCASVPISPGKTKYEALNGLSPNDENALIYIVRTTNWLGRGTLLGYYVDETHVGTLGNGGFLYFYSKPGSISISSNYDQQFPFLSKDSLQLNVEANNTYYISTTFAWSLSTPVKIQIEDAEHGHQLLAEYPLIANFKRETIIPKNL